jgi:hypothetical protein
MLALRCTIPDLALPPDAEGVFQRMMGLAFVQADLRASLHIGIKQPIDDKKCSFDPSDFPKGDGKIWTSEPERFIINPIHQMPGLNT